MTGIILPLLLAMEIQGAGNCPAAGEVEAILMPLLPPDFASSSADLATIAEDADGTVLVSLARPDGRNIASRRLPPASTCAEQAETVAVALAVWEAQIHPEISLRLDRLASARLAVPAPARPANPDLALQRQSQRVPDSPLALAIGAGLVGSWQPGSVSPGGRLDVMLGAVGRRWRWRLSLAGLGEHEMTLTPGRARWWRVYGALGGDYALPLGARGEVALGAAGVLGVANAEGSGFATDRTARSADLGIEAMVRVGVRLGPVRPWLGLALVTWLRQQTLEVTGMPAESLVLPRAVPFIALGADFCWQP